MDSSNETFDCTCNKDECLEVGLPMKIILTLAYLLIVLVGGSLHYGIAYYEFNGGDSQKRPLLNQLLSYMSLYAIFHIFIQTTSISLRAWIGPLNGTICSISVAAQVICMYNLIFVILEQTINRHIKLQKWKIQTKLGVKFWIKFYAVFNNVIATLLLLVQLYMGEEKHILVYQILSGTTPCKAKVPVIWIGVIMFGTLLTAINFLILKWKPQGNNQIEPIHIGLGFNNLEENPKLLTDLQLICVVFCLTMSALPTTPPVLARAKSIDFLIFTCLAYQITMGLLMPILIYMFNANLRLFIWDELVPKSIKDFCTLCTKIRGPKINHLTTEQNIEHSQNHIQELELQSIDIEQGQGELKEEKTECEENINEITKGCQPSANLDGLLSEQLMVPECSYAYIEKDQIQTVEEEFLEEIEPVVEVTEEFETGIPLNILYEDVEADDNGKYSKSKKRKGAKRKKSSKRE